MTFEAAEGAEERLAGVLARYVVLSRGHEGCTNVDLCASITRDRRIVLIEKWSTLDAQRAHFDSADMVAMAKACVGLLVAPPEVDLLDSISAHDLT